MHVDLSSQFLDLSSYILALGECRYYDKIDPLWYYSHFVFPTLLAQTKIHLYLSQLPRCVERNSTMEV